MDVAVVCVEGALDIDGELSRHMAMVHRVGEGPGLGHLLCGGEGGRPLCGQNITVPNTKLGRSTQS